MTVGICSRNCGNGFSLLKKFCAPTDAFLCVSRRTFVQQLMHKSASVGAKAEFHNSELSLCCID